MATARIGAGTRFKEQEKVVAEVPVKKDAKKPKAKPKKK